MCYPNDVIKGLLLSCAVLACCSSEDPLDPDDGGQKAEASIDSNRKDIADDVGGTTFDDYLHQACKRLIGQCQQESTPLNQPWKDVFVPWSEDSCKHYVDCLAKQTSDNCVDRLVTYFICLAKEGSFNCQACLNAYQFVQGVCPCIKACDPSCV